MVTREFYKTREDGVNLYKSASDNGFMIRKVGTNEVYASAIDIESAPYQYEETDTPIPTKKPLSEWAKKRLAEQGSGYSY